MARAFATVADLTARGLTVTDQEQAETFLEDASDHLRDEIGWQVFPPVSITVTAQPDSFGHIRLQGSPIGEIASVVYGGETLTAEDYTLHNGLLHVIAYGLVTVTYTVGYAAPPPTLVSWTCVLAADMLSRAQMADGGLGATPASISVEDIRVNYSTQQQAGTWGIPERALERLRSAFGATAFVT